MRNRIKRVLWLLALSLVWSGCGGGSGSKENFSIAASKLQRDLSPDVNDTVLSTLAENNNAFAFDLFSELARSGRKNLFFSPYSISEALAMTYAGARNNTKSEMAHVLHFDLHESQLHSTFNALDLHLHHTDANYTLSVADSLWAQKEFTFLDSYLDTLKVNYGADVRLVDFKEHTEDARAAINGWIEAKTHERIKNLIPRGALSRDTRLVLTNAVYFKAQWMDTFNEDLTQKDLFYLSDGATAEANFMYQRLHALYTEDTDYQAIDLPYRGERTSMLIVLPAGGKFDTVQSSLKSIYPDLISSLTNADVRLTMPKFEFTTDVYALKKDFQALGMQEAFEGSADFSGITGKKDLIIDDILHKAFIKVDEQGSEAAAATVVMIGVTGAPGDPSPVKEMVINRPFIFFIKDLKSGQILFMGVVQKP